MRRGLYAFLGFALLFSCIISGCRKEETKTNGSAKINVSARGKRIQSLQTAGIISSTDYERLMQVQTRIERTQSVSGEDISFVQKMIAQGPIRDTGTNRSELESLVFTYLVGRKDLTPAQQKALYQLALPYISVDDAKSQATAMMTLASTRDPRAIGALKKVVATTKSESARKTASNLVTKLQSL